MNESGPSIHIYEDSNVETLSHRVQESDVQELFDSVSREPLAVTHSSSLSLDKNVDDGDVVTRPANKIEADGTIDIPYLTSDSSSNGSPRAENNDCPDEPYIPLSHSDILSPISADESAGRIGSSPNSLPRKESILRVVYNEKKDKLKLATSASRIPLLSPERENLLVSPLRRSPLSKTSEQSMLEIDEKVFEFFFESVEPPDCEQYLSDTLCEDPEITFSEDLLDTLTPEEFKKLMQTFEGKETSENWRSRFDTLDIVIGHLRTHLPEDLYDTFQVIIYERIQDILMMVNTKRSKLLPKVILFVRDFVYFGNYLNNEDFITLIHLLIPLTRASQTVKYIYNMALKALCLMIQSINIDSFISNFDPIFLHILTDKKLKGEKYTCLFMVKLYILNNWRKITCPEIDDIVQKLMCTIAPLSIDSYQKTRSEISEIYLILLKIGVSRDLLTEYYRGMTSFMRTRLPSPEGRDTGHL